MYFYSLHSLNQSIQLILHRIQTFPDDTVKLEKLMKLNIVEVIAYDCVAMFNMAMQVFVNLNNFFLIIFDYISFFCSVKSNHISIVTLSRPRRWRIASRCECGFTSASR